jgi:Phasin protein
LNLPNDALQHQLDVICALHYTTPGEESSQSGRFDCTIGAPPSKEGKMTDKFDDIQKYGKEQIEAARMATNSIVDTMQVIAIETADYSRKSFENGSAFLEKLLGAKSYDSAIQLHSEYWKSSYAGFISQATKLGELYSRLANEAFKPLETAFARVHNGKS